MTQLHIYATLIALTLIKMPRLHTDPVNTHKHIYSQGTHLNNRFRKLLIKNDLFISIVLNANVHNGYNVHTITNITLLLTNVVICD